LKYWNSLDADDPDFSGRETLIGGFAIGNANQNDSEPNDQHHLAGFTEKDAGTTVQSPGEVE